MSDAIGMPPQAVANMDQSLAAADRYLDTLVGAYHGATAVASDAEAVGVLGAIAKGLDKGMADALLAAAVRRLARPSGVIS